MSILRFFLKIFRTLTDIFPRSILLTVFLIGAGLLYSLIVLLASPAEAAKTPGEILMTPPIVITESLERVPNDTIFEQNFGWSMAASGDLLVVGAIGDNHAGTDSGAAYVYGRDHGAPNNWNLIIKLIANDGDSQDDFGNAVAVSENVIAVGAWADEASGALSGSVYIYERNQGGEGQWGFVKKLTPSDAAAQDRFGTAMDIQGDRLVVSSYSVGGAAYIFEQNLGGESNWGEFKKITPTGASELSGFGNDVSLFGDIIAVGAFYDYGVTFETGVVYVFEQNFGGTNNWGQAARIFASDGYISDGFGLAVSVFEDELMIGADWANREEFWSGAVYHYRRSTGEPEVWTFMKKIVSPEPADDDIFGLEIDLDGDQLIVSASGLEGNTGKSFVFERNAGGIDNWGHTKTLIASDRYTGDYFGQAVANVLDTYFVGASYADVGWNASGAAYIYQTTVITTTPVASPTPINTPTPTPTPTKTPTVTPPHVFLPALNKPPNTPTPPPYGIHGFVTWNGAPVEGVTLELRFFNGSYWSTRATTGTNAGGFYSFKNVSSLDAGQYYYVRFQNTNDPTRLFTWHTASLDTYQMGTNIQLATFDILNIALLAPENVTTIELPATFAWGVRPGSITDRYEFNLFDLENSTPYFYTDPPLGYVGSYVLSGFPPGFEPEVWYGWDMWVYGPSEYASQGYGISFYYRVVKFSANGVVSSIQIPHSEKSDHDNSIDDLRSRPIDIEP